MKTALFTALTSLVLTTSAMANDAIKGIGIPLEYGGIYLITPEMVHAKEGTVDKKPPYVRIFGVQEQASEAETESMHATIVFYDLIGFNSDNPPEITCTKVDEAAYYGNSDAAICQINGKDLGEQMILSGWYRPTRSETYNKGMNLELAKRYDAAEKNARDNKKGIWKNSL